MNYFKQLMVERRRESIARLEKEIDLAHIAIVGMSPRHWHRKRTIKAHIKMMKSYIKTMLREIEMAQ